MNKNVFTFVGSLLVLAGCSEAPKKETADRMDRGERVREYSVIDWSHKEAPEWVDLLNSDDLEKLPDANSYKYFVGESGDDIFDRTLACTDAELDIKKRIATEIETSFQGATSSTTEQIDGSVNKILSDKKMAEITQKISGVDKRSQYWEKRDYRKVGQIKPVFHCKVLARIPKKHFNELLEFAGKGLIKTKREAAAPQSPSASAHSQNPKAE